MEMEIVVPAEVPVMTLRNVAFFPQALLPLHIFEPRYRQMLRDVLATDRLFAVAGINPQPLTPDAFEPPHRVATMGIVRACQENADGTSNLLIQGLARIEIRQIVQEEPYRTVRIRALASIPGAQPLENERLRARLSRLLSQKQRLGGISADEFTRFLRSIDDPEVFADLAAFSLCSDARLKQKLLETLDVNKRLGLFSRRLATEVAALKLQKTLQGDLPDTRIDTN